MISKLSSYFGTYLIDRKKFQLMFQLYFIKSNVIFDTVTFFDSFLSGALLSKTLPTIHKCQRRNFLIFPFLKRIFVYLRRNKN